MEPRSPALQARLFTIWASSLLTVGSDLQFCFPLRHVLLHMHVSACSVMPNSATPWAATCHVPLSMGIFRQEYWSGWPFLNPEDLPDPGTRVTSSASPALASRFFTTEPPGKPYSTWLLFAYIAPAYIFPEINLIASLLKIPVDFFFQ